MRLFMMELLAGTEQETCIAADISPTWLTLSDSDWFDLSEVPCAFPYFKGKWPTPLTVKYFEERQAPRNLLFLFQDEASESATKVNLDSKLDDVADKEHGGSEDTLVASDSKKDPFKRRQELLVKSELFEVILVTCI